MISNLPDEILYSIVKFVDISDWMSLIKTSQDLCNRLTNEYFTTKVAISTIDNQLVKRGSSNVSISCTKFLNTYHGIYYEVDPVTSNVTLKGVYQTGHRIGSWLFARYFQQQEPVFSEWNRSTPFEVGSLEYDNNGKKHGYEHVVNAMNGVVTKTMYISNFRNGHYIKKYDNDVLLVLGSYYRDMMDGEWTFYNDENDLDDFGPNVQATVGYKNNKRNGRWIFNIRDMNILDMFHHRIQCIIAFYNEGKSSSWTVITLDTSRPSMTWDDEQAFTFLERYTNIYHRILDMEQSEMNRMSSDQN